MKHKYLYWFLKLFVVTAIIGSALATISTAVHAAPLVFIVNSVGDGSDISAGNLTCDTGATIGAGAAECTLRAAIEEANAHAGADTINFAISGVADFINQAQNGYTIKPGSELPTITEQVTIDGYSQPGAAANTAVSPNPLNGILLIELDGENAGSGAIGIQINGDNITIKGLVINRFRGTTYSRAIGVGGTSIHIAGNYIGSDPTGLLDRGNQGDGVQNSAPTSEGVLVGGTDPADRNLIVGNDEGGISPNSGHENWTIQGNYIGVAANGTTAIGNSTTGAAGGISFDNSSDGLIGGTTIGAANVISGNMSIGIAPDHAPNLLIQGNLIGTDYSGLNKVPNGGAGILISNAAGAIIGSTNPIGRNIISGNNLSEIQLASNGVQVIGNYIGTNIDGTVTPAIFNSNGYGGVMVFGPFSGNRIGGVGAGRGNLIAPHVIAGVGIEKTALAPGAPTDISVLGNSLLAATSVPGIDLLEDADGNILPDTAVGLNPLAPAGNVPGEANDYINHPVITGSSGSSESLTATFDLNAAGSPINQYRVEFFASDDATPGQGVTFVGSADVAPGSDLNASLSAPSGFSFAGKYLTATTTELTGNTNINGGFGSTSELSQPLVTTVTASNEPLVTSGTASNEVASSQELATTGEDLWLVLGFGLTLLGVGATLAHGAMRRSR